VSEEGSLLADTQHGDAARSNGHAVHSTGGNGSAPRAHDAGGAHQAAAAPAGKSSASAAGTGAASGSANTSSRSDGTGAPRPAADRARNATDPGAPPPPPPRLNYDALRIREHERAFAQRLHGFVPSPRAAKRFTNVYRLLKARLGEGELHSFEGTPLLPGEFRAVMFLLAVLTGFQESAPALFSRVLASGPDVSPWDLFGDAEECGVAPAERERFQVCLAPLRESLPGTLEPFLKWAPLVARFSFNVAKTARSRTRVVPRSAPMPKA